MPDRSLLLQAMRHAHDELHMPPGKKLPDHVLNDIAAWIKHGAAWPQKAANQDAFAPQTHWAFRPVKPPPLPDDPTGWAQHPIDRFIAAKLRGQGLEPVGPADRRALLRRLTFDLIGLPPAPEEIDAFLGDASGGAYAKVVDRLLASPHHGERWGRHWLDVVRYADTAGDNADYPIPEAHRYRDYVVDAFNADMPFDQFVQEQLAGDLLAREKPDARYAERIVATGFLALVRRYATAPYEFWHLTLEDAIDTTGQAFLGLSLRCPLPRSQVRPGHARGLLRPVRHLRADGVPLRRLGRVRVAELSPATLRRARTQRRGETIRVSAASRGVARGNQEGRGRRSQAACWAA